MSVSAISKYEMGKNEVPKYFDFIFEALEARKIKELQSLSDKNSRLIKRHKFPELIQSGRTMAETSLVVLNAEGDAIVLTEEFERELFRILKKRYS